MNHIIFAWKNIADIAAISGNGWSNELPPTNMQDRLLCKVTRSNSLNDLWFKVDLGSKKPANLIALIRHNMSQDATIRITAYDSDENGVEELLYDSQDLPVWPELYPYSELEWEDNNWWSGKLPEEDILGYPINFIHLLPHIILARYWKIEITDLLNKVGFVDIGRLFISKGFTPMHNYCYGSSFGFTDESIITTSLGGTEYYDMSARYREFRFVLENINQDAAFTTCLEMIRMQGVTGEILIIPDHRNLRSLHQSAFLGRMRNLNTLENSYYNNYRLAFEIKEIV
jgi:hypothetical protein